MSEMLGMPVGWHPPTGIGGLIGSVQQALGLPTLADIGCNPICDSTNNTNDQVLKYARCREQAQQKVKTERKVMTFLQGVSFGNLVAGCALTGPEIAFCVGAVGGVQLGITAVNWIAGEIQLHQAETACMQQ